MNTKKCGTALASAILAVMLNEGNAMGNCAAVNGASFATAWGAAGIEWEGLDARFVLMSETVGEPGSYAPNDLARDFAKQTSESVVLDFAASEMDYLDPLSLMSNDPVGRPITSVDSSKSGSAVSVYLDPETPEPSPYSGVVVTAREPRLLLLLAVGMAAIVAGRKRLRSV